MFTGVMNLMMNTAMGRPATPASVASWSHGAAGERRARRLPAATSRRGGTRSVSGSAGLATYQIYAEAFKAAARAG